MNFILYSDIGETNINKRLGLPEYSYYFVLKSFRTALEAMGRVCVVQHPEVEVDALFKKCKKRGEKCIFLSFSPPNKTLIDLQCPTVSVFAWEYSTIPNVPWADDPRNDWRTVFARHGRTITLSDYTVRTVREAMGQDFPVIGIPTPLWENFAGARQRLGRVTAHVNSSITLCGTVIDSRILALSPDYVITASAATHVPAKSPLLDVASQPAKTLRYRLVVTKRHVVDWYREVVRDLLPLWLAKSLAMGARRVYSIIRLVKGCKKKS